MELMNLLKEKQLSVYQCAKESHVPYTTLSDIVKGKTRIEKCTAETIYKLARTLHLTMEELLTECFKEDENAPNLRDFEIYKSNICHLVKDKGEIDFIIDTLKENQIRTYWERQWYRESFYLLAMVDYLSRENGLPLCNDYEDIRNCKLYGMMADDRLFTITKSYLEKEMIRGTELSGIKKIRLHDLRHSHASLLISKLGAQPNLVADRLGHEKIQTTLSTYSHLYPNQSRDLADQLNGLVEESDEEEGDAGNAGET